MSALMNNVNARIALSKIPSQLFSLLVENIDEALFIYSRNNFFYANRKFYKLVSKRRDIDVSNFRIEECLQIQRTTKEYINSDKYLGQVSVKKYHAKLKDGTIDASARVLQCSISNMFFEIGIIRDITKEKYLRNKLIEADKRYMKTLEQSGDIIYLHDKGRIVYINNAGTKLLGARSKHQIIGRSILDFIPSEDKELVAKRLQQTFFRKREFRSVENKMTCFDGRTIFVRVFAAPCLYKNGLASQVILKDITEEKNKIQKLRKLYQHMQTIREEERLNISREIHDDLGSSLTVFKYKLYRLVKNMQDNQARKHEIKKSLLDPLNNIICKVKELSTSLRPRILDDFGIGAAINWQCKEFAKNTGIRVNVSRCDEGMLLEAETSIAIFRIFQEAITNVLRHSKATCVTVSFTNQNDRIELKIEDNGVGIVNDKIYDFNSFGILGMRERAKKIGATIQINGLKNRGTRIVVTLSNSNKTARE